MAVIKFTEADKLAGSTMEKGAYTFIIPEIEGPKASNAGKSVNWIVTFRCTTGKYAGKEIKTMFNSVVDSRSVLGTLLMHPSRDFMLISAAQQKIKFADVPLDLDTDDLLNKPFDAMVDIVTADGNLINSLLAFMPEGTGGGKLPF